MVSQIIQDSVPYFEYDSEINLSPSPPIPPTNLKQIIKDSAIYLKYDEYKYEIVEDTSDRVKTQIVKSKETQIKPKETRMKPKKLQFEDPAILKDPTGLLHIYLPQLYH